MYTATQDNDIHFNQLHKEGRKEGKSELLIKQLIKKFNGISDYYIENIKNLPEESIELIATNIFDLEKIEDIEKYL